MFDVTYRHSNNGFHPCRGNVTERSIGDDLSPKIKTTTSFSETQLGRIGIAVRPIVLYHSKMNNDNVIRPFPEGEVRMKPFLSADGPNSSMQEGIFTQGSSRTFSLT
jgi:hypothetical protein